MPGYVLLYKKPAVGDIQRLTPQIKRRLEAKLIWFSRQQNPMSFAERLTKSADAQYRFRIGDYRVLFDVEDNNLVIFRVRHRREVYR